MSEEIIRKQAKRREILRKVTLLPTVCDTVYLPIPQRHNDGHSYPYYMIAAENPFFDGLQTEDFAQLRQLLGPEAFTKNVDLSLYIDGSRYTNQLRQMRDLYFPERTIFNCLFIPTYVALPEQPES